MNEFRTIQAVPSDDPLANFGVVVINGSNAGVISCHRHLEHAELTADLNGGTAFRMDCNPQGLKFVPKAVAQAIANFHHLPTDR